MTAHRHIVKTAAEETLAGLFASADPTRAAAFADFAAKGLPNRREEAWHYTDLRSAMASVAPLATAPDASRVDAARAVLATRPRMGDVRLVLLDGVYVEALSDKAPAELTVSLVDAAAPSRRDAVVSLNVAFAPDGLKLVIAEGVHVAPRIEIAHLLSAGGQSVYSRIDVTLGARASARIAETFSDAQAATQRNAMASISLGAGAKCAWVGVIDDAAGLHLESQIVDVGEGGEFSGFALVSGGALARRQIFAGHQAPDAKIALGGLSLLDGARHADTTLVVEHGAPGGQSREYYKHIIADRATGVYQGKVIVKPHAQKTDGGMKSQAILLSANAVMNNKPELEIFADDVVCGHGATVGALDPEQAFYLQARGIPRAEAEAMLLEAFGVDAIDRVEDEVFAERLRERMRAWLAARSR